MGSRLLGVTPMNGIPADIRYALRAFRRAPGFFAAVITMLALGTASSVAVFSLVDGILVRPLPYSNPHELVTLTSYSTKPPFDSNGSVSYNDYLRIKEKARSFAEVAVTYRTGWSRVTVTSGTAPAGMQGAFVSPNLFRVFGRSPLAGRPFTEDENRRAERVVVISERLWAERFGSSAQAIGQDLRLGREQWRVIGVMPADFQVPFLDTQLWAPVLSHPDWKDKQEANPQDRARWDVIARLKPGVTRAAAQAELNSIESGLKVSAPDLHQDSVRVVALRDHFTGQVRRRLLVLLAAVGFLLFIGCANVANLLLARASQREREIATRTALGASRSRIVRQLVVESLVLCGAAGIAGTFAASALVPVLKILAPAGTPLLASVRLDERGLLFGLLLSLLTGLLLGIAPVFFGGLRWWHDGLRSGRGSATDSRRSSRFRGAMIAAEFAVAMMLLTGAGLMIRSFVAVLSVHPGFDTSTVLTVQLSLPSNTSAQEAGRFYRSVFDRVRNLPGVQAVGGISNLFFLNETRTHALREVEGHAAEEMSAWTPLVWAQVAGDYFQAMGIRLVGGRFFDSRDREGSRVVVIVNESLARRYWPNENAVGKHIRGFDPRGAHDDWLTVIGVVADTRSGGLEKTPFSQVYELQSQRGDQLGNLVVRSSNPAQVEGSLRGLVRSLNPDVIVSSMATMSQLLEGQETERRFETWLIGVFSSLALLLAMSGIFAIMHYWVAGRRGEMGVRIALGAKSSDIAGLVLGNGTRLALAGIVAGGVVAMWMTDLLSGMLYNVKPNDAVSFVTAAALLVGVALLGCYLPARAASRVDPISALRQE